MGHKEIALLIAWASELQKLSKEEDGVVRGTEEDAWCLIKTLR